MPSLSVEFGFYPLPCDIQHGDISIGTLANLEQKVSAIAASAHVYNNWQYAPPQKFQDIFSGKTGVRPFASRVFGLPKTHVLRHKNADGVEHMEFLVWCISFFVGMRLTTAEAGFLDATPIEPGLLTDFVLSHTDLVKAIALAESFWQLHSKHPRRTKRMAGIIHALFLSQNPRYLQYEEFMLLYTALDACFALTKSIAPPAPGVRLSHADRIDWMCQRFGISTPVWAVPGKQGTAVSLVRNDSFHEALFFDEPLGYAIYGGNVPQANSNVPLEMQALICRLVVALLGDPNCSYVKSATNMRDRYGLDLS